VALYERVGSTPIPTTKFERNNMRKFIVTKPFTITGAHIAVLLILIVVSVIITIKVEKKVEQSKLSHYVISSDSILNSTTIPDSVKLHLFSARLKNLEQEMFNRIMEEHQLNKTHTSDIEFVKKEILEIEEKK